MTWLSILGTALRWAVVIPGALIGASVARSIVSFMNAIFMMPRMGEGFLVLFGLGCFSGVAFVFALGYTAAWIAPAHKHATALVITALLAAVSVVLAGLALFGASVVVAGGSFPIVDRPAVFGEVLATTAAAISLTVLAMRGDDVWGSRSS